MKSQYNGQVQQKEVGVEGNKAFNWVAFFLWIISFIISLIPVYISALKHLGSGKGLDTDYWFQCITKDDVLWVFATLLLFALFNSLTSTMTAKRTGKNTLLILLHIVSALIFILIETTWICLKYFIETTTEWPIYLGAFLMICSLIISTPLEINFIQNGD